MELTVLGHSPAPEHSPVRIARFEKRQRPVEVLIPSGREIHILMNQHNDVVLTSLNCVIMGRGSRDKPSL